MSVNSVSNVAKGTAVAAGIGAGWGAANSIVAQKVMIKNPVLYHNSFEMMKDSKKIIEEMGGKNSFAMKMANRSMKKIKNLLDAVGITKKNAIYKDGTLTGFKNLKMNWKQVGKTAGKGAVIVAGIYLAYKGIKSLFARNDEVRPQDNFKPGIYVK